PWIAKYLNNYSCIAMAGATSEDTTLPMLIRYTDEETVVLAVFNGVICSACVPFLIELCYRVF
ncbi:MAG: LysO family transporter, partial [Lachnospiraceae bacterium]